jgi:hypothetical protein
LPKDEEVQQMLQKHIVYGLSAEKSTKYHTQRYAHGTSSTDEAILGNGPFGHTLPEVFS